VTKSSADHCGGKLKEKVSQKRPVKIVDTLKKYNYNVAKGGVSFDGNVPAKANQKGSRST